MKNNYMIDDEWHVLKQYSKTINHELRTPLVAIKAGINAVKDYLPKLIEGYNVAKNNNLNIPTVQQRHLDALSRSLEHVEKAAHFAATYLNMLTMNLQTINSDTVKFETCSMKACLTKALKDYPCHTDTQQQIIYKIKIPEEDFVFNGDERLIVHVLMNLIQNSLYCIQDVGSGDIYISIQQQNEKNILSFKNTGRSVNEEIFHKIFNHGFSTKTFNMGCGLSFCHQVMQFLNGDIICEFQTDQYTVFNLIFPL